MLENITQRFEKIATGYDEAALVQAEVAQHLVDWAMPHMLPATILDVGAGTGLVSAALMRRWPHARITALDSAPAMLRQAQQKIHGLHIIAADAAHVDLSERYDAIFCSMVLHWLPDPHATLQRWCTWLKPGGKLYAALLVEGSFQEWRDLCAHAGLEDGLWPMPRARFADDLAIRSEQRTLIAHYASAVEFLRRLKATGTTTSRVGHQPLAASLMRGLLGRAPKPFPVSYETLYIELPAAHA